MTPIAVVIPTHLRPRLLAEAIASVTAQRSPPCELTVVDDARDGATRDLVEAFAATAPFPIRYVAARRAGVCNSRNTGGRRSNAPWIAFLDDDDVWREDFLLSLGRRLGDGSCDLAISGIVRHEQGAVPVARVQAEGLVAATVFDHPASMTGSNFVVRRETFLALGGFDPAITVFNDWDLLVRLVDAGVRYAVVPAPLAEWRDHPGPRIASPSLKRADGIEAFIRRYRHRLSRRQSRELATTALGIRRAHVTGLQHVMMTARLVAAHGPAGTIGRIYARLHRPDHARGEMQPVPTMFTTGGPSPRSAG